MKPNPEGVPVYPNFLSKGVAKPVISKQNEEEKIRPVAILIKKNSAHRLGNHQAERLYGGVVKGKQQEKKGECFKLVTRGNGSRRKTL